MLARLKRLAALEWLNAYPVRVVALACALVMLVGGTWWALDDRPDLLTTLRWQPVVLLAVLAIPLTTLLNAYEFVLSGRLIGLSPSFRTALGVTIVGAAANLFPLPGGTLVRIAGLKSAGGGYGRSAEATLFVALMAVGVAFAYAGGWMIALAPPLVASAVVAIGLLALVAGFVWAMRHVGGPRTYLLVAAVKLGLVLVEAYRVHLCLQALGVPATFAQASCLVIAAVVGSAVSLVPAGLGIRESVAAAIATAIALPASVGFLSAFLNRIVAHIVNALFLTWALSSLRTQPRVPAAVELQPTVLPR